MSYSSPFRARKGAVTRRVRGVPAAWMSRQRMECAQPAAAFGCAGVFAAIPCIRCTKAFDSGSKLRALHTLREVRKSKPLHLTTRWKTGTWKVLLGSFQFFQFFDRAVVGRVELQGFFIIRGGEILVAIIQVCFSQAVVHVGRLRVGFDVQL